MAVDFETPTQALFERLSRIPGIVYTTRIAESWDDTPPGITPSLMLTSEDIELFEPSNNIPGVMPPMFRVGLVAIVYVAGGEDPDVAPSVELNRIIAAVCNATLGSVGENVPTMAAPFLARIPGMRGTTLGGLCAYCRVSGKIVRAEGFIGHVAAARIPFEMVVTS